MGSATTDPQGFIRCKIRESPERLVLVATGGGAERRGDSAVKRELSTMGMCYLLISTTYRTNFRFRGCQVQACTFVVDYILRQTTGEVGMPLTKLDEKASLIIILCLMANGRQLFCSQEIHRQSLNGHRYSCMRNWGFRNVLTGCVCID